VISARFQIVFTYRCNLNCKWCDRFMDSVPWPDSDMVGGDLAFGLSAIKQSGIEIEQCRIGGGEAKMHPCFASMAYYVRFIWGNDKIRTSVSTNTLIPNDKSLEVIYQEAGPKTKSKHTPVMISPYDLGLDPEQGFVSPCRMSRVCGRLFDAFGFAACPYEGPMGRLFGIDPYQAEPVMLGRYDLCCHCVHSLPTKKKKAVWQDALDGKIEFPTKSYREALDRFAEHPTVFKRFQERL